MSTKHAAFDEWWYNEGSGMRPMCGEDAEAHVMRICQIAWANGKDKAREEAFGLAHGSAIPAALAERLRLQAPERVRQDAEEPGKPKMQVVIDDGPWAGQTVATCQDIADAALIVEIWNWVRTLSPNTGTQRGRDAEAPNAEPTRTRPSLE